MLALIATILIAVYALGGTVGEIHLGWLGLTFLAAHFVLDGWAPWRRP